MALTRAVRTSTIGGAGSVAALVDRTGDQLAAPGAAAARRSVERPDRSISGSVPRSKRAEASLRRPRRFELRAIAIGSHHAISSSTVGGGVGDLGRGAAHDPGDADGGVVAVGDDAVADSSSVALDAVEGDERSPSRAQRTRSAPPATLARS